MRLLRQIFSFLLVSFSLIAHSQIRIGEWREHLPYQKAKSIIVADDRLYCLTESGMFSYSLFDNEIVTYSKTKGLSESEISAFSWSELHKTLVVGYANGNLDLISEGGIYNLADIKRFSSFASKRINSIISFNGTAYLGTDFGIVVVNLDKKEISDTYLIGDLGRELVVNDIQFNSTNIWAATNQGVYTAELSSNNLVDFANWEQQTGIPDFEQECDQIVAMDDKLFVSRNLSETSGEIYQFSEGVWNRVSANFKKIYSFRNIDGTLYVIQSDEIQSLNQNGIVNSTLAVDEVGIRDFLVVENRTFIADYQKSLLEKEATESSQIKPDGPLSKDISNVYSVNEQTWAVAGDYTNSYEGKGVDASLFLFQDQNWVNYSNETVSAFTNKFDLLSVTGNKRDQSLIYAASWGDGIFVFENNEFLSNWNSENSPLGTKGISGMDTDEKGDLWILDANSSVPVKVRSLADEWTSLAYSALTNQLDLKKIVCLDNGDKWVMSEPGQLLFAFNENGTLSNIEDDAIASFSVRDENNSTISTRIYDLVEDQDGNIWLGTSNGIAIYSNPENIFRSGDFFAYQPIITIDGSTQFLLGSETVRSLALNGANQKWLGTENSGVFLVSENGDEQLAHFTSENSPLPSNTIEKISVNPGTGEVFFVTDKGMVSYKGKVTKGTDSYDDLYVYPNPVRETYYGDVVVSGLIAESTVKITDISGNLVMEGKSEGGQYIWDGKNFNGSRVHTGVYLIFCSNFDGSKSKVIKLLFIH